MPTKLRTPPLILVEIVKIREPKLSLYRIDFLVNEKIEYFCLTLPQKTQQGWSGSVHCTGLPPVKYCSESNGRLIFPPLMKIGPPLLPNRIFPYFNKISPQRSPTILFKLCIVLLQETLHYSLNVSVRNQFRT